MYIQNKEKDIRERLNILFLSYSDTRFDGRLRELINTSNELGNVYSVIRVNTSHDEKNWELKCDGGFALLELIVKTIMMAKRMPEVDILFIDNRMACVPGIILSRLHKGINIIQDVRELYLASEQKTVRAKIGCWFEQKMLKKATIVICANKYRAQKMKELYSLDTEPIVYENVRKLEYGKNFLRDTYDEKYKELVKRNTKKIISTSGWDVSRTNDKLVEAVAKLDSNVELLMVGGGTERDKKCIEAIIEKNNLTNVHLMGKVQEEELKYLISISHIGIVNYGKYDTNNQLCASGKLFEFLFEGIPVVTTENLPLVEYCEKFGVGESDDLYKNGIEKILQNYEKYLDKVAEFLETVDVNDNNRKLLAAIQEKL